MEFEQLETERLYLRKLTDELYEQILKNSSDEEIMRELNLDAGEVSKEKTKAIKGFSTFNKSLLIFQLLEKSTHKIIGWCGFHTWYLDHDRAEIGYTLKDEQAKRKGYMSEAISAVVKYGFEEMKLKRIEAFIEPNNIPSIKLVQGLGFQKEGHLRNHYQKNGKLEDSVIYGLLLEEYHLSEKKMR
ncbi:GNAT family N-acetyltransferase [Sediminitomix flava]|nr:GNAT family protein [Sediminitomix flava]